MSTVYDYQGSGCRTQRDGRAFSQLSMCRMFARTHDMSVTAHSAAWTELPMQAVPNREGSSRTCSCHAGTPSELPVRRLYPSTSSASVGVTAFPACTRNKPSNARITDTSFCASAEHRSAKTGRTTRILTTQGES